MPADVYATLAELKAAVQIDDTDTRKDDALNAVLASASRTIDNFCGRYFGRVGTTLAPETKVFDTDGGTVVIGDLVELVDIDQETAEDTWTPYTGSIRLLPLNAAEATPARPYTMIRTRSGVPFPTTIRIAGVWGWPAVPDEINQATLLQAARLFKSKDVPLGVVGGDSELGLIRLSAGLHPDAQVLVQSYQAAGIG